MHWPLQCIAGLHYPACFRPFIPRNQKLPQASKLMLKVIMRPKKVCVCECIPINNFPENTMRFGISLFLCAEQNNDKCVLHKLCLNHCHDNNISSVLP